MAADIFYGKSVNPVIKDNARSRRKERRRVLGLNPENQQYPSRWEKLSKRQPAPPLDLSQINDYILKINELAKKYERRNHRIWYSKPKTEYGVTASLRPITEYKHWKHTS